MAYGSPGSLEDVAEYLRHVRNGREPTGVEVERLRDRYRCVGGRTPLLDVTRAQAEALQERLHSHGFPLRVYVGMKHWHPFVEDTVKEIVRDGTQSIIGLAMAPHYSRLSIGGYAEALERGLSRVGGNVVHKMIKSWHTEPLLIKAISKRVLAGLSSLEDPSKAAVLFTAHSLPMKMVEADDPYQNQLLETSFLVAQQAGVKCWEFAFQSAGHPPEEWLGPRIRERISSLSAEGFKEILVCPVGFVSDHLEILYDLDIEAASYAGSLGSRMERTASLNADPDFIEAMASVTMSHLKLEASAVH